MGGGGKERKKKRKIRGKLISMARDKGGERGEACGRNTPFRCLSKGV